MHIIRRVHSIILLLALLVGGAGMSYVQAEVYSGTCGAAGNEANVTWELNTETGLLEIEGSGPMTHYWSLTDIPWYNYRQYVTSITVRYGVTAIGHHAFYDFPNVTDISCDYVTSIGVLSFGFCRKLTSLKIPESVTSIGDQALWYNESLREVHVEWKGDAVPTMPSNIHNFEASQIKLHIPCGQTAAYIAKGWDTKFTLIEGLDGGLITTTTNNFLWTLSCDSVWTVSGTGALKDFPNPLYVDLGIARVTINISSLSPVFSKRKVVKGAVFEEGITYIGNNTLYKGTSHSGYPYLTTLTLPSSLTSMSSTAFTGCIALKDVYVSWTTAAAIPTWNQSIDVSQATLHVPCGTTALYQAKGWQDFIIVEEPYRGTCGAQGDNLTWTLSCDGTLTISGTGEMYNWMSLADRPWHSLCTSIQRVVIEEGVTTTGFHAFYGAANLTSVSLPSTLQTLQFMTFFGCGKLTTLTIPSSVTYVGTRSLEGCSALTDVYMSETGDAVPTMPPGIHTYDASRIRLHIPCGQTAAYVAKGWNTKFTIEEGASGSCGTNVQWHFDPCTGVLSLSGTGSMTDYSYGEAPWSVYRTSITSVSIANGITSIGSCAFNGCRWITSISIPNSVTSIGYSAFDECSSLASISIPNSVTDIGHDAFYGCRALTSIVIPNSVTDIGYHAFYECTSLASVSLSNNLTSISTYTFYNCSSLTSITIPNSVTSIGSRAFYNCSSLTSIIIPNGVTSIGLRAFEGCTHLTTVYIPSSVTSIGLYAFYGCNSLTDLYVSWTTTATIPNWNSMNAKTPRSSIRLHVPCGTTAQYQAKSIWKSCTIVEEAQGDCGADGENLRWALTCDGKRLTIYGTGAMRHFWTYETDIPWWSARGTIQELVIKEGVTTIGNHAFVTCSALTSVSLPNTLTAISYLAFGHCTSLPLLVIPSSVTSMAGMFIHNTPSLTDVYVSWTDDDVPTMPADLHPYDASQKRLHIPCGQEAAYTAKGWNTKFTYVTMFSGTCGTNVQWTLDHCTGVLTISGSGAMTDYSNESEVPWRWWRESITSVIIQNGVTRIGDNAFYNCANITSMTVPPSITSFGTDAFYSSWAMESLYITDLTAWCNISFSSYTSSPFYRNCRTEITHGGNCYVNGTQVTTLTIPNGITEIPNHTFCGFANITSIQFNQATTIGNFAISSCHGLTHVTIPEGVTTIGNNAFAYCTNLQSISVPASVTSLGTDVLYNSLALTDIYVHWTENIPSWGYFTSKNPQSDITLHVPCGTAALYQAAEGWQDYTIVEDRAHGTCGAQGDNLTWSLSCDGTLTIQGTGAMADWSSSDKVPWYSYRSSITTVNIRDGVTSVGNRAFIDCAVLTSVTIPNSVTSISNNAFFSCSALTDIAIPNSVTTIGQYVFYGCSALTNITIPGSVTSLGESTFKNCSALTDIYVSWIGTDILELPTNFTNNDPQSSITLHVPCSAMSLYKAAEGWKDYTIQGEGGPYTITVRTNDGSQGTVNLQEVTP